jgi:TonB family protein
MREPSRHIWLLSALLLARAMTAFGEEPDQPASPSSPPATDIGPDWKLSRAVAADRLKLIESSHGPTAPELILPLINLAHATVQTGDTEEAGRLIKRAHDLLDQHPAHDRSLRLAVLLTEGENLARQGRIQASNDILYQALSLSRSTTTIKPLERAEVLDRLVANVGRQGDVTRANSFSGDALRLRKKHYGAATEEYAAALLKAADWYRFSGQFGRERDLEEEALAILERRFGPNDWRLAVPLIRIGTSHAAQQRNVNAAERVLQRAVALDYGASRDGALTRAEALASLADLRVVFGNPEDGTPLYTEAWQAITRHEELGPQAANRYFSSVRRLFVARPDLIADIGAISLEFTVSAVGTLDAVRIAESDVPASALGRNELNREALQAMRRSRYRPRVVDGVPVATPGTVFALEFCMDADEIRPTCKGKGDVSAVR